MKNLINPIKLISGIIIIYTIKYLSYELSISSYILFYCTEFIFFVLSGFVFSYATDFSKDFEFDKILKSLYITLFFSVFSFALTLCKSIFPVWFINIILFISMISLPVFRDYFFYYRTEKRIQYRLYLSVIVLVLYKLFFNFINRDTADNEHFNSLIFAMTLLIIRIIYSIVDYFFITGSVEFDDYEYPVFLNFKVGRNRLFEIFTPDIQSEKRLVFSITSKNDTLFIKPNTELKIDNTIATEKTELADNETIKIANNYFTVTKGRGSFFKKFFILFFYFFIANVTVFSIQNDQSVFTDISRYPEVQLYVPYYGSNYADEPVFILESDQPVHNKFVISKKFPIEMFLLLDVTGNLVEQYKSFNKHSKKIFNLINTDEQILTINIVTFGDEKSDIQQFKGIRNYTEFNSALAKVKPLQGNDFFENPLDAIFSADILNLSPQSLKVFVLFTDAPPHQRGSRGKDGVLDFTDKTVSDCVEYVRANNILFLTASFKRYKEYQPFYQHNENRFYEIENIDDIGNSLYSIASDISRMIKIEYKTFKSKRTLLNNCYVFFGDDAKIHKLDTAKNKIKERSFIRSLFDVF
ncbi:MAG TPA: hypothetical protein DDY71_03120 [Spirochaetia bacterium]|nr:MAG: hypothetical protein A2Y30_03780 [Spirochaetes bacterium GWE1_32_154]OHD48136.1 MAG: hypothetical protein A2Y29_10885 [Spirochaetes bacterium GWE2_31_10]HBD94685.1 hypothetical protein [Spirochaetia bacterium]HBI36615.1 hypothetical protein [Spirochaetia bacterium]